MLEMDLRISVSDLAGVPVVVLNGEVDAYTCSNLRDAMIKVIEDSPNIVISLLDVEYIDSSGLGTLVVGLKRASERNGKIALVCQKDQIRKVFEITGLEKVFPIFPCVDDALALFGGLMKNSA